MNSFIVRQVHIYTYTRGGRAHRWRLCPLKLTLVLGPDLSLQSLGSTCKMESSSHVQQVAQARCPWASLRAAFLRAGGLGRVLCVRACFSLTCLTHGRVWQEEQELPWICHHAFLSQLGGGLIVLLNSDS